MAYSLLTVRILLRVMGHQEVSSLSPDDDSPSVHYVMTSQLHNALVEVNKYLVVEKALAENYTVSKDGLQYAFKLRKGVKFHDGSELTAEDVKYTYDWYMNPANAANKAINFASVAKVETPDNQRLSFTCAVITGDRASSNTRRAGAH